MRVLSFNTIGLWHQLNMPVWYTKKSHIFDFCLIEHGTWYQYIVIIKPIYVPDENIFSYTFLFLNWVWSKKQFFIAVRNAFLIFGGLHILQYCIKTDACLSKSLCAILAIGHMIHRISSKIIFSMQEKSYWFFSKWDTKYET